MWNYLTTGLSALTNGIGDVMLGSVQPGPAMQSAINPAQSMTGLPSLGSGQGMTPANLGGGISAPALPTGGGQRQGGVWGYLTGGQPAGNNASNPMWGQSLWGDATNLLTSEQGTNMLGTGVAGLNAYNQYQFNKEAADALERQLAMQEEAFARDKASYEQRQNLNF